MRIRNVSALVALVLVAFATTNASAQQLFVNPGFETPITYDGPPFVGSWEGFQGPGTASVANSTVSPRTGAQNADLSILLTDNTFTGLFQDVFVAPGDLVTFGGWNRTPSNPLDVGVEFRIEWRSWATNTEVARTLNTVPLVTADYTQFSLTATAPPGADIARAVYAIQTFGGDGPTNTGTVFLDDMFINPEPTTMALGLMGVALTGLRRRRA